jgi:hypothetical protein
LLTLAHRFLFTLSGMVSGLGRGPCKAYTASGLPRPFFKFRSKRCRNVIRIAYISASFLFTLSLSFTVSEMVPGIGVGPCKADTVEGRPRPFSNFVPNDAGT